MAKKLLSVVLALTMIFTVLCIGTNAEEPEAAGYKVPVEVEFPVDSEASITTLGAESAITVAFELSKTIGALDGETAVPKKQETEYIAMQFGTIDDVPVTFFYSWSEDFRANGGSLKGKEITADEIEKQVAAGTFVFDKDRFTEEFKQHPQNIFSSYTLVFANNRVFGDLKYTATLNGLSCPPDLGEAAGIIEMIAPDSDILSSVPIPTPVNVSGEIADFPSIAFAEIDKKPAKQSYTDMEKFNPAGLSFTNVVLTNGETGTITYGQAADSVISFTPAANERLVVGTTEIVTLLEGKAVLYTPITVNHSFTDKPVQISSDIGSEAVGKYGKHAFICEGCGEIKPKTFTKEVEIDNDGVKSTEIVDVAYEDCIPDGNWVSNGDATFAKDGTSTCHCVVCGAELTKIDFRSAQYNITFSNMHFLLVIFDYIETLLRGILMVTK